MIKDNKNSKLALAAMWIIIITCIATNTFYLKNIVLNIAAAPIFIITVAASWLLRRSFGGKHG